MPQTTLGAFIDPMTIAQSVDRAKFFEKCGFDSVWLSDETLVFNSPPDMVVPELFPTLAMVAAATKKVKVGTGVVDASIRHPVKTAQSIATVDTIAGGRVLMGIGGGEAGNRDPFGMPLDHPFGRMEEAVKIMKLLFSASYKKRISFSGRFYSLEDAYLKIHPVTQGGPPIIVSAFGPRALKLAGEFGDGWLSFSHTPKSYQMTLRGPIADAARKANRTLRDFQTAFVVPVGFSKDGRKAAKVIAPIAKDWMVWSPDNMRILAPDVRQPEVRQPYAKRNDAKSIKLLATLASQIPDEIALQTAATGSLEECVEQLMRFSKAGARRLICYVVAIDGDWTGTIRKFCDKVLPHFT